MFLALGGTVQERDEIGGVQWGDCSKQMVRRLRMPDRQSVDTLKHTCSGIRRTESAATAGISHQLTVVHQVTRS